MTMLPRLEAEAQLAAISAAALGSGSVKQADTRRQLDRLERQAHGGRIAPVKAGPETFAAMGIAVEVTTVEPAIAGGDGRG